MDAVAFFISWLQTIIMTLYKGHNSTKGDNPDLKKYLSVIFDEESIYENFKTVP